MTRAPTLTLALLIAATLVLACSTDTPPALSKVAAPELGAGTSEAGPAAPEGAPRITSDAATHEFGAIKATDSIEHVFKIRNAGTADLKIERVQRT